MWNCKRGSDVSIDYYNVWDTTSHTRQLLFVSVCVINIYCSVICVRLTYDRFHFLLDLGQHTSRYLRMRMHGWWRHHSIRVIHLHVALQIAALDESLAAQCARVRFLARMGAHVRDQVTCETDNGSDMKISADKEFRISTNKKKSTNRKRGKSKPNGDRAGRAGGSSKSKRVEPSERAF